MFPFLAGRCHTSSSSVFPLKFKSKKFLPPLLNYLGHSHLEGMQFPTVYYWGFFFICFFFFNLTHSLSLEGMHFGFREMQ